MAPYDSIKAVVICHPRCSSGWVWTARVVCTRTETPPLSETTTIESYHSAVLVPAVLLPAVVLSAPAAGAGLESADSPVTYYRTYFKELVPLQLDTTPSAADRARFERA